MIFFGRPTPITRFLGQVDLDDPTNLPAGLAALCLNTDFTRDSPGVTCANTRCGNNLTMQGLNQVPITGIQEFTYQPELATETFFQMPLIFDWAGMLQREFPVGSGRMKAIPAGNFTPPVKAHMLSAAAGNKVWAAFTDLLTPASYAACFDPKTLSLNPFGMKPFGWRWAPNTPVLQGEMCTPPAPANGNGHTYQAQNSGVTGAGSPNFPTSEGATVDDNGIVWKELTMVLANRVPAPSAPLLALAAGGTYAAGLDVYVRITLTNQMGETLPSVAQKITTLASGTAVAATIPALVSMAGWIQGLASQYVPMAANVYVAAVATGQPAPPLSGYTLFGSGGLGTVVTVTGAGAATPPPNICTARVTPGQLPTPDVEPALTRTPETGGFPAGRDVYVLFTYSNGVGETTAGPAGSIINTNLNEIVLVTVSQPTDETGAALYQIATVGVYEADVPTGSPAPPTSAFALVSQYTLPESGPIAIVGSASGSQPPTVNTTGPGGQIVADTPTGGPNGTQGYRYASVLFVNNNETFSGFTAASVVQYDVDEDGWEIGSFNVATGPAYVIGRAVNFTVADGTQDGPFFWNGLVNLTEPSQNQVYPSAFLSDGIAMTSTFFLDNVTTQGTFNFTDEYLEASNDVTDRLRVVMPPICARIDYLESVDRLALTGVPGYNSGCVISLGEDYESFYGDTSPVPVAPNGEQCFGVTDKYKGIPFVLREKSGFTLQPNAGAPGSWDARRRWSGKGPCGFRAWDACGEFVVFADEQGLFKYDETDPDLVSKEIPRGWNQINWKAKHTLDVYIDENTHTVRVQVPTGRSMVPNKEICLSYLEGWQDPIHFSPVSNKEVSMDMARRYSFNDFAANVCMRMRRNVPDAEMPDGLVYGPELDSAFAVNQLLYGSSRADGIVNARTPGIFNDNGAGIDWQYETVSSGAMQAVTKPEGFNLNADGQGRIYASFLAARDRVDGESRTKVELQCRPIDLTPGQRIGITRKVPIKINEFWRVRFTNGCVPDTWASLKQMTVYTIPVTGGRGQLDR